MSDYDELLPAFIDESQQHIQNIEPDLLTLEQNQGDADDETVNRIFRGVHSIKGASGFLGLRNIGELTHAMENSLSLVRNKKIIPDSELIDALFAGTDALRAMLDNPSGSEEMNIDSELASLRKVVEGTEPPRQTVTVSKNDFSESENSESALPISFNVSENEIQSFVKEGYNLYSVRIYLNEDLRQKNKSPYDFINNMESLGRYVDSFLDIQNVSGLSDCLENELAFNFIFATVLDLESTPIGLDLSPDRVAMIDLNELKNQSFTPESAETGSRQQIISETPQSPAEDVENSHEKLSSSGKLPVGLSENGLSEKKEAETKSAISRKKNLKTGKTKTDPAETSHVHIEEKVRVKVSFLNELVNIAGELVLGRNQLMQKALPLAKTTPGLNPVLQHISRVTSELQEKIMQMRMQPVSMVFDKFGRLVRTLARSHSKEVKLITFGSDVELDKTIIEGLSDPLTHLVRNSVDHGIELPGVRERLKKPRFGTIELRAFHQGGQVHLVVNDNGRGVDGERVGLKAVEKKLITREQLSGMSERERINLIFHPGFSTVEKVTDLSGRGVGMDVVMTNIEKMGGTVHIETKKNKGTQITLILPLTLAIVSGLSIKSKGQYFILPEVDISELVRVKPDEMQQRLDVIQNSLVLRLRETLLPLVNLNEILGTEEQQAETNDILSNPDSPLRIIVIKNGDFPFGLITDSIVSTEEIVVKPLPRYLKKMKCFSGMTILGNGEVSLILDVAGILKKASVHHPDESAKQIMSKTEKYNIAAEMQTLLLFENNTPERFAIPLELIRRIELIPVSSIEYIREKQFLQYQGRKLRLIFLEDHLPVTKPERQNSDTIGVIIPKQSRHPAGIVFNNVISTISEEVILDTTTIMGKGLFGSAILDGRITLLPDMYRLFEMAAPEWYNDIKSRNKNKTDKEKDRILLVDDTPFFRMVENEYLVSAGYETVQAENGVKALQILEEETFDAVILDIIMPRLDGWGVIKEIRSDERLMDLPVMAVTSLTDDNLVQKGMEAGFNAWEFKLDKTKLLEKLDDMLGKSRK